jgi:hypothetical protein
VVSGKGAFTVLAGAGFTAIALAVLIGFEEANGILMSISAGLLVAAPAAVLARIASLPTLTGDERRQWLRALTGRRALQAWSVYLAASDERAALQQLARRPPGDGA